MIGVPTKGLIGSMDEAGLHRQSRTNVRCASDVRCASGSKFFMDACRRHDAVRGARVRMAAAWSSAILDARCSAACGTTCRTGITACSSGGDGMLTFVGSVQALFEKKQGENTRENMAAAVPLTGDITARVCCCGGGCR